ncbi:chemotaxis protein CheC [Paenibacillus sp. J2TS4]|uniref:chemotaxis protein CheC n=1 Tax=Paenibacillus sp. J2TS4 TaxID=2807194 RepID=UPI001B0DCC7C|nr:chemotaxis protein CheC [Paenibacillus sp. J2TS4]GIP33090.1 CheY-P phosphatase CheC [Paenibacillus sp. J2TS4]
MNAMKPMAEFQMDVLREVGNIGAGHAATALSKLLGKQVDMKVPKVKLVPFEQISDSVGGSEQVIIAVFLRVEGDVPGNLFFIFTQSSAKLLLSSLVMNGGEGEGHYTEMELSALQEIGNILAGSYLTSLAELTRLELIPSVPLLAMDMAGAILSYGLLQYGQMGDQALFIDTNFFEGSEAIEGHFFFIPDPDSFDNLFSALGVPAS